MAKLGVGVAGVVAVACTLAGCSHSGFEGEIRTREMKVNTGDHPAPTESVVQVRGHVIRGEEHDGAQDRIVLFDMESGRQTVIDSRRKMAAVLILDGTHMFGYWPGLEPVRKITVTERAETIAGGPCRHVLFEQRDGVVRDECLAKGFENVTSSEAVFNMRFVPPQGGTVAGRPAEGLDAFRAEFGLGGWPLRVERIKDDQRVLESEVISIDRKSLDPLSFEIPKGYTTDRFDKPAPKR